jgi:anti-sigma-K factor RskA
MTNPKFEKPDVAKLYRRFTRSRAVIASLPEADALLALADGQHNDETERLLADVARSGMHADLLRFTRALEPESARLGVELERALEGPAADHARGRRRGAHVATPRRAWLRVASSLAAALVVAIAVWSVQRTPTAEPVTAAVKAPKPDRIFAATEDGPAGAQRGDRIFHDDFKVDEIFKAKFSDG